MGVRALTDWAGGKVDGWEDVSGASTLGDHLAWAQYGGASIPNYWAYAKPCRPGQDNFVDCRLCAASAAACVAPP